MNNQLVAKVIHGAHAHVDPLAVFEGLTCEQLQKYESDHSFSVWQLLNHMNYWQLFVVEMLEGENPNPPERDEDSWISSEFPDGAEELSQIVDDFKNGIKKLIEEAEKPMEEIIPHTDGTSREEILMDIALHNSYHAGQVVHIRKRHKDWN
ncbi:hypothetical protein CEY16_13715 [Halalkalibacillus sediminis]|uniref:DinB-like domain-containing protein n=1 Tax=Halalkalibacillus sediminis TaxID=2018042 RepID=A0A2I0QR92_9BACI|nr:DinB family protein [Halalkalibacillus sediminis]PKR76865.1 hypothetical protein CEY16_13715 [Halalkalibacillus sediminis]